ncbi:vacuolar-sorting receptor [Musa troglodytarum]|uniref:Vacuolar-sorting receptor n=1 Tax=Musa troglodytarum TaxID=320322 RepID=A0A9E7JDD4_9LILI|nr:vacuolar-sorting receptor [Musa troglodytarum]
MASLREQLAVLAVLLAVAIRLAAGRFVVETESISIVSPTSLRGHHDASIANFGVPNYGHLDRRGGVPGQGENGLQPLRRRPLPVQIRKTHCYFALKAYNGQQNGAAAVIVADTIDEPLLTMDAPEEDNNNEYVEKINIPSALVSRTFGNSLKEALAKGSEEVVVKLDWRESMPHPDERVEYELWTNSNDECGDRCDEQMEFVTNFKGHAQLLEKEDSRGSRLTTSPGTALTPSNPAWSARRSASTTGGTAPLIPSRTSARGTTAKTS